MTVNSPVSSARAVPLGPTRRPVCANCALARERTSWEASSAKLAQRSLTMAMPERSGAWQRVVVMLPL
uniref:Uncharacterized protein n=2 Tax=Anguilla anguilla TaxID=7936 RepID=A0A0E9Y0U5_ANGAN